MVAKPNTPTRVVDTAWFRSTMQKTGKSQNKIADQMGMADGSTLSKYVSGTVEIPLHQAILLAKFMGVPLFELLRRAGYLDMAGRPVMQLGKVVGSGKLVKFESPRVVPVSPDSNSTVCWSIDAGELRGSNAFGAILNPASDCIGRICMIEDASGSRIRRVEQEPGMRADRFTLHPCLGFEAEVEKNVSLQYAMPITSFETQRFG